MKYMHDIIMIDSLLWLHFQFLVDLRYLYINIPWDTYLFYFSNASEVTLKYMGKAIRANL